MGDFIDCVQKFGEISGFTIHKTPHLSRDEATSVFDVRVQAKTILSQYDCGINITLDEIRSKTGCTGTVENGVNSRLPV